MCGTTWVEFRGTLENPCGHFVIQASPKSQCAIGIVYRGGDLYSRAFCWEVPQGIVGVDGEFCAACWVRLKKNGTTSTEVNRAALNEHVQAVLHRPSKSVV